MNEILKIEVQADVQKATNGLKALQAELNASDKTFQSIGNKSLVILNNQLERLQRIAANPNLTTAQFERLGQIINKTNGQINSFKNSLNVLNASNNKFAAGQGQATFALTNFSRVVQDAPFGIIGIANNIDPLIQSFTALRASTGSARAAFAALGSSLLGPAGIAIGISAVTSLLTVYAQSQQGANKQTKESVDLFEQAAGNYSKTAIEANVLVNALKSGELTLEQTRKAQNELIKISPDFKAAFSGAVTDVNKLDEALISLNQRLLNNIKTTAAQTILQQEFNKLSADLVQRNTFQSQFPNLSQLDQNAAFKPLRDKYKEETKKLELDIQNFGQRISEVFKFLDVSYSQFVDGITKKTGQVSDKVQETLKLTDLLNRSGVIIQENENLKEQIRLLDEINSLLLLQSKYQERLRTSGQGESELRELGGFQNNSQDIADLQFLANIQKKQNEELLNTRDIVQAIGNDFVSVFSTVSVDGENAFQRLGKAIEETTKRILIQFAVTKALTFLLNTIAPGSGSFSGLGSAGGSGGVLRGNDLQLLIGRGG